jgi:hypothetical protein
VKRSWNTGRQWRALSHCVWHCGASQQTGVGAASPSQVSLSFSLSLSLSLSVCLFLQCKPHKAFLKLIDRSFLNPVTCIS